MSPESRFAVKARLLSDPSLRGERFRRVRARLPRPHLRLSSFPVRAGFFLSPRPHFLRERVWVRVPLNIPIAVVTRHRFASTRAEFDPGLHTFLSGLDRSRSATPGIRG